MLIHTAEGVIVTVMVEEEDIRIHMGGDIVIIHDSMVIVIIIIVKKKVIVIMMATLLTWIALNLWNWALPVNTAKTVVRLDKSDLSADGSLSNNPHFPLAVVDGYHHHHHHHHEQGSMNKRAVYLHVMCDCLSSLAVVSSGVRKT